MAKCGSGAGRARRMEVEQMKKRVIIDLDPMYASIITFTVIGSSFSECRVTSRAADLSEGMHFVVDETGHVRQLGNEEAEHGV